MALNCAVEMGLIDEYKEHRWRINEQTVDTTIV